MTRTNATLGDVINDALNEWHAAHQDGGYEFMVAGRKEHIDRFDILLLCRLYEAGFSIARTREAGPKEVAEAVTTLPVRARP